MEDSEKICDSGIWLLTPFWNCKTVNYNLKIDYKISNTWIRYQYLVHGAIE